MNQPSIFVYAAVALLSTTPAARSQDGEWAAPFPLPLIAIHSAVLPTGEVLLFSAEHGVPGIHGWVLDPESLNLTEVPPPAPWNPDCAGHSFLPDGRLLVTGGTLSFNPLRGPKEAFLFDPFDRQWTQVEDMAAGRWYPTNVTLQDGSVLTMAGLSEVAGVQNSDIERWDPNGSNNWQFLGQKTLPYYPLLHLLSDGSVLKTGPDSATETYDPVSDTWTPLATTLFAGRYEAPSVQLPPDMDRFMLVGGYTGNGQPTGTAEILDLAEATPAWTATSHMAAPRMEHDAVILPDGQVLVVGGRSDNDASPTPVLTPELFDPATETWDPVAPHAVPRMYHSTAVLLPDGRVLAAGGDFQPSGEIYSPPYLFRGTRPTISGAPTALAYGEDFSLTFTSGHANNEAVLIRLSAVTHSNNMSQRFVGLGSLGAQGTSQLPAPSDARVAPPGFYMLFVVDSAGVPSVSRMVRVITRFGDFDQDDDVDLLDFAAFAACFTGTNTRPWEPSCEPGDFDADGDIDCDDWVAFQAAWTAPGGPPDLANCPYTYCVAAPHSQGPGAEIGWSGSTSVGTNDLTLTVQDAPSGNFGLFFYGPEATQIPFGDGFRCVGSGATGLFRLAPPVQTDGTGGAERLVDFTQPPANGGAGAILPGSTWYFQFWFRDPMGPGGGGFSLSNGLSVTFLP